MLARCLLALLVVPTLAVAQAPVQQAKALTAPDLETFLDGLVRAELERENVAGAVISVVKDGQVLLAKGYGYSDVEHHQPVSADSTVFRIASISKLFTATAVMQLVEQGKLNLDTDVQTYLDFKLRRHFPDKITLRNLLTHTAGFEEQIKDLPADSGKSVPLREHIVKRTPDQIYRPGTITSYSNYGADLAGYIVQVVSGTPYAEYVRLHILEPLGMTHSSIAEPPPPDVRRLVSKEYALASDSVKSYEVLQGEPSGQMASTGADMTKFMIAHLQLGRYGDHRILAESTAKLMATTQFRTDPRIPCMALGFFEESENGYRIIGHGGDLTRFHSHLSLLMDESVGLFISVNSAGDGGVYDLREAVRDAFLNRYFPPRTPLLPAAPDALAEAKDVAGPYTLSRRGETTLTKVTMLAVPLGVEANPDGTVDIPLLTGANGQPVRWTPVGKLEFRNADGSEYIGFVTDASGLHRMAWVGGHELHRTGVADNRTWNLAILIACVSVFLATLVLWPVAAIARRRFGQSVPVDGVSPRLRATTRVVALIDLLALAGLVGFILLGASEKMKFDSRVDPWLGLIRLGFLVGAVGTIAALVAAVRSWREGQNWWARIKYTALAVASVCFTWFVMHWHVLSANFNY